MVQFQKVKVEGLSKTRSILVFFSSKSFFEKTFQYRWVSVDVLCYVGFRFCLVGCETAAATAASSCRINGGPEHSEPRLLHIL